MLQARNRLGDWMWKAADVLGMTSRLERRQRRRLEADFRALLSAPSGFVGVKGLDASRQGIGVLSAEPIELDALVFVRLPDLGLAGFAYVRRCELAPTGSYTVGLEFRGELSREDTGGGSWNVQRATHSCGVWDAAADL